MVTAVEPAQLLAGVPYYQVQQPAFLDQALAAQVVRKQRLSLLEFRQLCTTQAVYVYTIDQHQDDPPDTYIFNYAVLPIKPQANLLVDVVLDGSLVQPDTFTIVKQLTAKLHLELFQDLRVFWGRAELVRQLGEQLLTTLEAMPAAQPYLGPGSGV